MSEYANATNYHQQGGTRTVIGGSLDVASGGEIDIESGGAFKVAGTDITTELATSVSGLTATDTEINNVCDNSARLQTITATGAVTVDGTIGVAVIASGGAYAITLDAPSAAMRGRLLVIEYSQGGTDAVTLALTNVQGGSASTTATFNADNETLILVGGESKWNVVAEIGVTLS